jgi:enoyl-CoA hydratase
MDYSKYEFIKVERKEGVAILTLNRPEALNTFNEKLHWEVRHIFTDVGKDDETKAIILTGAGKAFCAGGDLKWLKAMIEDPAIKPVPMSGVRQMISNLLDLEKPIIAALNGDTIGLGATIALFCDIVIASETARIGDPHVMVGLATGDGGIVMWPLLLGMSKAKEFLMTGKLVTGAEAERIGLINHAVPPDKVQEEALKLAQKFATGPLEAIKLTKIAMNKIVKDRLNLVFDTSLAFEYMCYQTEDYEEGIQAILERRPPQFKGR